MARANTRGREGKPKFLPQALLISIPVVILGIVGSLSLRQDRAIARHEAAERSREIAEDVLAKFSSALTNEVSGDTDFTVERLRQGRQTLGRTSLSTISKHHPFVVSASG